jgi:hypothetical protein
MGLLPEYGCNLCVKTGPASLKEQCINILGPILTSEQQTLGMCIFPLGKNIHQVMTCVIM